MFAKQSCCSFVMYEHVQQLAGIGFAYLSKLVHVLYPKRCACDIVNVQVHDNTTTIFHATTH